MTNFKNLIAFIGGAVIVGALFGLIPIVRGDGDKLAKRDDRRSFYLTQTMHNGTQPLTACAAGYHMASLWEILDVSHLKYDTQLGFTKADSGLGPPNGFGTQGWVRTGIEDADSSRPGEGNCTSWTSTVDEGTVVELTHEWDGTAFSISPWLPASSGCSESRRVWCVQD